MPNLWMDMGYRPDRVDREWDVQPVKKGVVLVLDML